MIDFLVDKMAENSVKNKTGKKANGTCRVRESAEIVDGGGIPMLDGGFRSESAQEDLEREEEQRFESQTQMRRERVQRQLAERHRENSKPVRSSSAADEDRAKQAEAELMAMVEEEKRSKKNKNNSTHADKLFASTLLLNIEIGTQLSAHNRSKCSDSQKGATSA